MEATWRAELEKQDAEEAEKLAKLRKHVREATIALLR